MAVRGWSVAVPVMLLLAAGGCRPKHSVAAMEEAAAAHSPAVGRPAPAFRLPDQEDRPVRLKDLRGRWVVLYFYPKNDTPGCICEATEFTELLFRFQDMNASVYGISEDSTESHRAFIKKFALGMDLLSDPDHAVMKEYGAWVEAKVGDKSYQRVIRSTFLIGPDGTIRHHWPEVIPKGHAERVRRKLSELQRRPSTSDSE